MDWLAIGVSLAAPMAVGLVAFFGARKLGLTQAQQSLVSTLQGTVSALESDLGRIKASELDCKTELARQEGEISDLRDEVFELRTYITRELVKQRRSAPRQRPERS